MLMWLESINAANAWECWRIGGRGSVDDDNDDDDERVIRDVMAVIASNRFADS